MIDAIVYPVDETNFKYDLPRYVKKFPVEVPQYAEDQPTELWVIRTAQGDMNLVASNVDPTHESWTGLIKGWPEPSLAFRCRHWELSVKKANEALDRTKSYLNESLSKPEIRLLEWELRKKNRPSEVANFSGPDDPAFVESVTNRRKKVLSNLQVRLQCLMEERP